MPVAGDHLRGRHGCQRQCRRDVCLDGGVDVAERAHRAAQLAHGHGVAGRTQSSAVTVDLQRPQRHLGSERGGLGVDAVRAADHHRVAVLAGQPNQRAQQVVGCAEQQIAGVAQHPAPRPVDHVAAGEAVVDPRAGGCADGGLHHVDECGHVVIGDPLALVDGAYEGLIDHRGVGAARRCVGDRHDADRGVGLGGEQLDLEVAAEAGRVAEHGGHLGQGVAGDHDQIT